jgi:hypothetical protein
MSRLLVLLAAGGLALAAFSGCDGASSARTVNGDARDLQASPMSAGTSPTAGTSQTAGTSPAAQGFNSRAATTKAIPAAAQVAGSGVIESSIDDIRFPMDKAQTFERSMLTPKTKSLFDKKIRIRGYMYPTLRRRGLSQFVLVRDNMECCFGPGAALYDCILVSMKPGQTAEYTIRPIAVEGVFRIEEVMGPEGRPLAIYQMAGEAVQ